jgi:hypothetical protein
MELTPELEQIIHELKHDQAALFDKFDELGIDFDYWGELIYDYKQKFPPTDGNDYPLEGTRWYTIDDLDEILEGLPESTD